MPIRPVPLRSPFVLVAGSGKLLSQLASFADREGFPRSPYDIEKDLNTLTAAGGVPVTLDQPRPGKTDWSVLAYTRRYMIRLFLTGKYKDAYSIVSVYPLRLRDHQRLAEGYLLTRARGWRVVGSLQEIPPGTNSGWDTLTKEWNGLTAAVTVAAPPTERQEEFLGTLGEVIDATQRISEAAEPGETYAYREARPTGGKRSGAAQSYEFTLVGSHAPDEGAFVQLATRTAGGVGTATVRGQVTRASGMRITIGFDDPVDWDDLRGEGEISATTSTVAFRTQREALGELNSGRARNPGILPALVEGRAQPPASQAASEAPAFLNEHQREAFARTLARPDVLAVIGPPGTGKTTTITEIVRAAARCRERVIVCSQNNRAVDNVLGRLPAELLAIRVGNETRVTEEGKPYLLQRQASDLRTQVLNQSRRRLDGYGGLDAASEWARELARRNAALADARSAEAQTAAALETARRDAGGPATQQLDQCARAHAESERAVRRSQTRIRYLEWVNEHARAWSGWVVIGWIFALLATWSGEKRDAEQARSGTLADLMAKAADALEEARRNLIDVTKSVPAVLAATAEADAAADRAGKERGQARTAARSAARAIQGTDEEPPNVADDDSLTAAEEWFAERLPKLTARRDLLTGWTRDAADDPAQLYPELLRYADVLASTCTGAGSRPELSDLDFDLAIVDESGQIGVADALIPLVRARRAVLVGDHQQLPPFLDSDVDAWGQLAGDPVVKSILTKSALELLVEALPQDSPNVVWLTEQRRMPEVIAEFASSQFYGGRLETPPGLREHRDGLFRSPMAFIDTSTLDWPRRRDRAAGDKERLNQRGYQNQCEARLLADLAVYYDQARQDWGIIVPYKAQAESIRKALSGRAGSTETVGLNVGTVDSFQGGERDVILYGFTRSNPERGVGFLKELRRLNVAITRARTQLVLVGDMDTLTSARNAGFRDLARSLRDYVAARGEIVPHDAARDRLHEGRKTR